MNFKNHDLLLSRSIATLPVGFCWDMRRDNSADPVHVERSVDGARVAVRFSRHARPLNNAELTMTLEETFSAVQTRDPRIV